MSLKKHKNRWRRRAIEQRELDAFFGGTVDLAERLSMLMRSAATTPIPRKHAKRLGLSVRGLPDHLRRIDI